MPEFSFTKTDSPHNYYPNGGPLVHRFLMYDSDVLVAYTDYFINDGWSYYILFWVNPGYRNDEVISEFIRNGYLAEPEIKQSFWWRTPAVMEKYLDAIALERPDIGFGASGSINKFILPTE